MIIIIFILFCLFFYCFTYKRNCLYCKCYLHMCVKVGGGETHGVARGGTSAATAGGRRGETAAGGRGLE